MNLTTHIILKKKNPFLSQTLESLAPLRTKILVANLGTDKESIGICQSYKAQVRKYPWTKNLSVVRNHMAQDSDTEWNLWIEPWEALMNGAEHIAGQDRACRLSVLCGDSLRKEVRLWPRNSGKFVHPVYETLDIKNPGYCPAVIWENRVDRKEELEELLDVWEKAEPLSQDMKYFRALQSLSSGDHQTFVRLAKQYLFREQRHPVAYSMLRYYLGLVECIVNSDLAEATRNALACIAANPLMAEYWCLLGDVFFKAKDLGRAEHFYENAKLLGARRLSEDPWPMHIVKYEEYPDTMIEKCRSLRTDSVKLRTQGSTRSPQESPPQGSGPGRSASAPEEASS